MSQAGSTSSSGSGPGVVETLTGNTGGTVGPSGNNINIVGSGGVTVAGNPSTNTLTIASSGTGGIVTVEGDTGSVTGTTITLTGGTTGLTYSGSGTTLTEGGTLNVANGGTGSNTLTGVLSGNGTSAVTASTVTQHDVLVGGASNSITSISPNTSGLVLTSNGTGADPSFQANPGSTAIQTIDGNTGSASGTTVTLSGGTTGLTYSGSGSTLTLAGTLDVVNGGTGDTSLTAYAVLCGGTTSTGPVQSIVSVGTSGQVLTSNGASAFPTFQSATVSGIITVDGDSGSITGSTVTIYSNKASLNCGSSVKFVNSGTTSTLNVTDGFDNTIIGVGSGNLTLTGTDNIGFGVSCLDHLTSGVQNIIIGGTAGSGLTSGGYNTSIGHTALPGLTTGSFNNAFGLLAGGSYTSSESSNIVIGNTGTAGESNVLRIGTPGTGSGQQSSCYIAGIIGATPVSGNTPQVVMCDSTGNLATISSSTSGLVLTSNGTATPSFQAIPASGVTSIAGTTNQIAASASTGAVTLSLVGPYTPSTYTAHGVLLGEGTSSIVAVAPNSTSGLPLISQGSSTNPAYGTAVVAGGGTGDTSFTTYMPITGGTTTTGALQSVATGTAGYALTYVSSSALPTWQPVVSSINVQTFTNSGTYTPTTGMVYCQVQLVGGGGGGGGGATTAASQVSVGSGGGAGEYASGVFSAASIGASSTVTIGAAGTTTSGSGGGAGGTTSLGSTIISAAGGAGGSTSAAGTAGQVQGATGGTGGTGGAYRFQGQYGFDGDGFFGSFVFTGTGGSGPLGSGGRGRSLGGGGAGVSAVGYGTGGSGGASYNGSGAAAGGAGTPGIVIITEYIT
jgi:hypothetical protein